MIIYCFDIKTKDLKSYNTVKRRFYYQLKKTEHYKFVWNTKSVILVDDTHEVHFDLFFSKFKENLALFKCHANKMEQVY
jgi:hypothetical protein